MQEVHSQLLEFLNDRESQYLQLLQQMVNINSFTANWQGVNQLGEVTAAEFMDLGFEVEVVQAENPLYGRHLVLNAPRPWPKKDLVSFLIWIRSSPLMKKRETIFIGGQQAAEFMDQARSTLKGGLLSFI